MWEIEYYEAANGQIPVKEFIEVLSVKERAKVARAIDLLEEFGINLGMPYAEHVEGELWELRTRLSNSRYRIIYFLNTSKAFIMLHGFVKKTRKISKGDLEIAKNRLRDYVARRRSGK
ncbi:MAG: type II toxin-antitoxin system RelE/ParE family toxin [Chloroflexi bacterium]|nr:type II toxin-antitoxin system RelE/ParE family toxin [Chloroflexota bacterium]